MEPVLVDDVEASRLLGISRSKFHALVANGLIPRLKIGRSARYRPADLLAFIERLAAGASGEDDNRV
jgi:excisionase family DNA binding protein